MQHYSNMIVIKNVHINKGLYIVSVMLMAQFIWKSKNPQINSSKYNKSSKNTITDMKFNI